ncbi:hypothetical protein [Tsukamurella spumae]|uniref:Uncharacterized protein n=1 Tax=Tsukamurella spumae TaxID=44753 RepID=A0A846WXM4_9ACTN|nr:hypothetical protein [Tsukamurella spumae]NKY16772.1 hypothetical protein [Tsukamurella spumae]
MKQVVLPFVLAAAIIEMILAILLFYIALVGIFYAATHREETYDFVARQLPNWLGDQGDRIRDTVDGWFRENPAPSAPPKEGDKDQDKPNEGTPPSPATIPPVPPAYIPPGGGSPGQTPPTPATPTPAAPGVSPKPPEIKPPSTSPSPTTPTTPQPDAPVIVPPPPGQPGIIPAPSTPTIPNTPAPGNTPGQPAPNTPLPGGPRPPIVPIPTEPPDPGKPPTPGRIDPDTGLPVIPQQPRPSTTPRPGTGSAPSASNGGGGQAPKPGKPARPKPKPTMPPPTPGSNGGPGEWRFTNEGTADTATMEAARIFQQLVTLVSYLYSYYVNGVKFDGYFNNIPGLGKTLVDAKNSLGTGYAALAGPNGTLADIDGKPWLEGLFDGIVKQANRQLAALDDLPNGGRSISLVWVTNNAATQAGIKAALATLGSAAERITVLTIDQWTSYLGKR